VQTEVATPWAKVGIGWQRTLRRPLLDADVYPSGNRYNWSVVCPLTLSQLAGGSASSVQDALDAADDFLRSCVAC
jgi:hypothetical protein